MGEAGSTLDVSDLEVRYGFRVAVECVSFRVSSGECLGLLGVNGAGKTSTLGAVLGMLKPSQGRVSVFGGRTGTPAAFRRIGFAPEDGIPPEFLTTREYLEFVGGLKVSDAAERKRQMNELMTFFELAPGKKIREFSKGMKKRIVLAQAFLGTPDLLVLDEPLNGLDPLVIMKLREVIHKHLSRGAAIIYSSHILTEVEKSCSHIALLKQGKLIYQGDLRSTVSEFGSVEVAFATKAGGAG